MTESIEIRYADVGEIEDLAELASRSFVDTFASVNDPANIEFYLNTALSVDRFLKEYADTDSVFLVAHQTGSSTLAGYAKLRRESGNVNVDHKRTIEIERIYVDKPFLGHGVGAALMRRCFAEALDQECDGIWLGVWEHNEAAIKFYERWGFSKVGSHPFMLGAEQQTDLVMARSFADGEKW